MPLDLMRELEIHREGIAFTRVLRVPRGYSAAAIRLQALLTIPLFTAILMLGIGSASAQGNPKPTTHAVPPDSTAAPTPNPAAGQHIKSSHLESSGPDCFGADAADPICGLAHPTPKPSPSATPWIPPMNLVWTSVDGLGWPLNPQWAWQVQPENYRRAAPAVDLCGKFHVNVKGLVSATVDLGTPPCTTTRLTFDSDAGILSDIGSVGGLCDSSIPGSQKGHVNWMPATYTGPITYESHDDAIGHDGDYNMQLVTPDNAGLTSGETHFMKVEFKDEETVDRFVTPFWTSGEFPSVRGNYAIVNGVVGLDGVHDFDTELHPAYLVAIRITDPGSTPGVSNPERWAFFVRNWGNEGMCSHFTWIAHRNVWVFKLPWRPSAKSVRVEETIFARNAGTYYDVRPMADDGIVIAVGLGDPDDRNVAHGEVTLYWDESGAGARIIRPPKTPNRPSIGSIADLNRETETARLDRAVRQMPPESKAKFTAATARQKVAAKDNKKAVRRPLTIELPTASIWKGPARLTLFQGVEDSDAKERSATFIKALCEAYKGNIPEYPKLCQKR